MASWEGQNIIFIYLQLLKVGQAIDERRRINGEIKLQNSGARSGRKNHKLGMVGWIWKRCSSHCGQKRAYGGDDDCFCVSEGCKMLASK